MFKPGQLFLWDPEDEDRHLMLLDRSLGPTIEGHAVLVISHLVDSYDDDAEVCVLCRGMLGRVCVTFASDRMSILEDC